MNIGSIFSRIAAAGSRMASPLSGAASAAGTGGTATAIASAASKCPKALKWPTIAAGVIGLGMCLYDANKEGCRWQEIYVKKKNNEAAQYWFDNSRNLHNSSNINAKLKDKLFNWETKSNLRAYLNAGAGYSKGFTGMIASDIVPISLSIAAIATRSKVGKIASAIALGLYSMYGFTKNVLGMGLNAGEYTDKYI